MDHIKRRDAGLAYVSDGSVLEQQKRARRLTQALNTADRADFDKIAGIVKELFGKSDGAWVNPPFYCDYGFNIEVGRNFFANYNCTILDVAKVRIGDNCQIAPNVAIYTAGHPYIRGRLSPSLSGAKKTFRPAECGFFEQRTFKKVVD